MISRRRFGLLGIGALCGCATHRVVPVASVGVEPMDGGGSLKVRAAAKGLYYGCAVDVAALGTDAAYARLVREQAGMVVAENAMKWAALRPSVETFDFVGGDALVAFAEANGMKVRGHCLCWHRGLPRWFARDATVENARELLRDHIERVAGRYAGRLHSWDVVNEAIQVEDGRADGLRDSPWLRLVGEDYVEVAFRTAREADPAALLTYNEYGLEGEDVGSAKKRVAVLALLRRLRARQVPVDALGIQAHLTVGNSYGPGLMALLEAVREMGLRVFVTELDVNDRLLAANVAKRDEAVAMVYENFLRLVLHEKAVDVVVTWGIGDGRSWLNREGGRTDGLTERALLFDGAGLPKKSFFAVCKAFDGRRV